MVQKVLYVAKLLSVGEEGQREVCKIEGGRELEGGAVSGGGRGKVEEW